MSNKGFFHFTASERRGTMIFIFIVVLILISVPISNKFFPKAPSDEVLNYEFREPEKEPETDYTELIEAQKQNEADRAMKEIVRDQNRTAKQKKQYAKREALKQQRFKEEREREKAKEKADSQLLNEAREFQSRERPKAEPKPKRAYKRREATHELKDSTSVFAIVERDAKEVKTKYGQKIVVNCYSPFIGDFPIWGEVDDEKLNSLKKGTKVEVGINWKKTSWKLKSVISEQK
ncbi:MAG: hypothetical protein AAGI23_08240 [Bacteroidota bacterium]